MTTFRSKTPPAIALAGAFIIPLLLILAAQSSPGQEKAAPPKTPPPARTGRSSPTTGAIFPLTGKHRTLSCRECHLNLVFEGTPTDCEVCHWQRRQDDRYSLRLGTRCSDCHTPQSWKKVDPALWSHETDVGYALEGTHRTLDCEACHGTGGFTPQPTDCYACHEPDYRGADDPNHIQAGFPTSCPSCHDQRAWENASFDHTGFTLQGQHASASCVECHKNGVYQGTSTECASCHLDDYNGTSDPNHKASGFPTDCEQCHGTSASGWSGADFDHSFPITSGRHSGVACSECHTTSDYRVFNCLGCHEQSGTNARHDDVTGYAYNSQACYACHPNGQAAPATRPSSLR